MQLVKIQTKIVEGDATRWVHFCYVPQDIKERFDKLCNTLGHLTNYYISVWAYNEFELQDVDTPEGMVTLREAVRGKYKELYPHLFFDSVTDKQGWLRVWFTENMERELKEIGK